MIKKFVIFTLLLCVLSLVWLNLNLKHEIISTPVKTLEPSNGLSDQPQTAPLLEYDLKHETQLDFNLPVDHPLSGIEIPNDTGLSDVMPIATIVIDPGHGPWVNTDMEPIAPDSTIMKRKYGVGASGNTTGTRERDINLNVSLQLRDLLLRAGYSVIMTRTTNDEISSNIDRANLANDNKADLMVRIHSDSYNDTTIHGASVLVPGKVGYAIENVDISRQYGKIILDTLVQEVGMANRGIITRTDQTGFNWSKVPIVTVEMGFLSNPEEDQLLATKDYQKKLADALYLGILNCFK